ncbi:MAG: VTT domain-containing protein [Acidobacteriota bacterium]|jgi:membrane protein DedA with SNARE-associated domain/rhodanese-related sulfurtransferase
MNDLIQFLIQHGYGVVFGSVLLEQVGIPIPSAPVLLAAGALSAGGRLSFALICLLAAAAAVLGNLVWYELGRRRGRKMLNLICRLSLEPDSCVRGTEGIFARHGDRALLVARFVPGLNTAAPPMAGLLGVSLLRFIALDLAGSLLWIVTFAGAGRLFSRQIEGLALLLAHLGSWAVLLAVGSLAAYLAWKFLQRRRFIGQLRMARISPEELEQKLATGENVAVVDLRNDLAVRTDPVQLPGAIRILPEEIESRHEEIPRDRDIVLYCTCPNEASSARAALLLRRKGIQSRAPAGGRIGGLARPGLALRSGQAPSAWTMMGARPRPGQPAGRAGPAAIWESP